MRNLKKFLAMALTVLMVVGSFGMVASANYDDVDEYQEAVNVMSALGIAKGYADTNDFGEDDDVQRQQLALWIAKMMTGKTDDTYVNNNFVGGVNYTAFEDVEDAEDLDVYTGAINYAANNGIIVGTSATTFEPTEYVSLQDVFAMVVRMLGYGSTAMNNNYPYSFIDKAISLGLDAGLGNEYIVDANATRGQTMQVLYNALTVAKSDGSTLGYDYFNVEKATVVITGTKALNVFTDAQKVTATVGDEDYIAFSILNEDGTVAGDANYYALRSEFDFDAEDDINLVLGYSYDVLTNDGFQTFITCDQNGVEVVDQTVVEGGSKADYKATVTIGDDSFKLVDAYSDYVFGTTKKTDDKEIILYTVGTKAPSYYASSYVYDNELNILDKDGKILLEWFETYGIEGYVLNGGVYLYKIPNTDPAQYIEPNDYIWSLAAKKTVGPEASAAGYVAILDSYNEIYKKNAYSETVLFDDNNDGTPDRGIYAAYSFGQATVTDGKLSIANNAKDATVYVDGEKSNYDAIKGQYVKYYYNSLINTLFVKEIYTTQSALITGINWNAGKVYFNGFGVNPFEGAVPATEMTMGVDRYAGAGKGEVAKTAVALNVHGNYQQLVGKKVNYILDGDKVVRILNAADDAGYMVVVNAQNMGYTTMGYKNILAYYDAANSTTGLNQSIVTVNANNNYWYSAYINGIIDSADTAMPAGTLLKATKDALGNYDVAPVEMFELEAISVENGIAAIDYADEDKDDETFLVDAATKWIIKIAGRDGEEFVTYVGNTADITVTLGQNTQIFKADKFIYIKDAAWARAIANNNVNGNLFDNKDVVYVGTANAAAAAISNQMYYGLGVNFTPNYTYSNLFNLDDASYFAANNNMAALSAKTLYKVVNGIIAGPAAINRDYRVGLLFEAGSTKADGWTYTILPINVAEADIDDLYTDGYEIKLADRGLNQYGEGTEVNPVFTKNNAFPKLMMIEADGDIYGGNTDILKYASTTSTTVDDGYFNLMKDAEDGTEKALVVYYTTALGNAPIFLAASDKTVDVTYEAAAEKPPVEVTKSAKVQMYFTRDIANEDSSKVIDIVKAVEYLAQDGKTYTGYTSTAIAAGSEVSGNPYDGIHIDNLKISNLSNRTIRLAIRDDYKIAVGYWASENAIVDTPVEISAEYTEDIISQINYYEFEITDDMIVEKENGELRVYIDVELIEK